MGDTTIRDQLASMRIEAQAMLTNYNQRQGDLADRDFYFAVWANHWIRDLLNAIDGMRPPARVITMVGDLAALPDRAVVLDRERLAWQKSGSSWESAGGVWTPVDSDHLLGEHGPILHVPTEEADRG